MKFIKFLGLLAVFIAQSSSVYCAEISKKDKLHADKSSKIFLSMINEIAKELGKEFNLIFQEDELGKVIHIIIDKVNEVYKVNLPDADKQEFLAVVCDMLKNNRYAFVALYLNGKGDVQKLISDFLCQYRDHDPFLRETVFAEEEQECIKLVKTITQFECAVHNSCLKRDAKGRYKQEMNDEFAALYKNAYSKKIDLLQLHKFLKTYYSKAIKMLITKEDSIILNFLAHYAEDELLDAVLN